MDAAERALRESRDSTFPLQITSMIDMFTIILVFLLKSYASSSVDITPTKDLRLPVSSSMTQPTEALKLLVSKEGIYVDDKLVVQLKDGEIPKQFIDSKDGKFIKPLFDALNVQAEKTKGIAKSNESIAFDGKVVFQGDETLSYQVLKKVMYTSAIAGYTDVKFAVVSNM